jgi:cytidylate kinase
LKKIVIAIDGPAGAGKTTTAKIVAQKLNYVHIDTGAMYRAVTLRVLEEKIPLTDADRIARLAEESEISLQVSHGANRVLVNGRDVTSRIRSAEVTKAVSSVSSNPRVRAVLVREQRKMAAEGGVVLEGRDIGTVVLPNADLKIFMVADVSERAKRRKKEYATAGVEVDEESLARDIEERDRKDSTRQASPLKQAHDAIVLDTSNLTIEEQVDFIVKKAIDLINKKQ